MTPWVICLHSRDIRGGSMDGRRHRTNRGFSIVEALIGITLFAMALMAFFAIFPYSLQTTAHDNEYLQAISAGQEYLDARRSALGTRASAAAPDSSAGADRRRLVGHRQRQQERFAGELLDHRRLCTGPRLDRKSTRLNSS